VFVKVFSLEALVASQISAVDTGMAWDVLLDPADQLFLLSQINEFLVILEFLRGRLGYEHMVA
jgi:hypothetical protein